MNSLPISNLNSTCIDTSINTMKETIYNYFRDTFGHLWDFATGQIIEKYKESLKCSLKVDLNYLKTDPGPCFGNKTCCPVITSEASC